MNFIRPKNPWVAAQDGEWVHLTAREAGRYRASRNGIVFHHTLGSEGNGYAICLACGRAEPEAAPENEAPPLPFEMGAHRPLRSKRNAGRCEGVDATSPFVIQRHRALGYQITTDVFELQLHDLPSASSALPLAAALRDALARKLGVEEAEMGLTVTQTTGDDGIGRWSVLLFDKAPGGAGFSVAAGAHIEDLLKDAASILDCPNKHACTTGCQDCIMCRDIESHEAILDRQAALSFTRKLVDSFGLPPELSIMGPETRAESQPLADAITREMEVHPDAELLLWLLDSPNDWNLNRWAALRAAQRLSARGRTVRVLVEARTLETIDQAVRIELYGLAIKAGCRLECAAPMTLRDDYRALVWIGTNGNGIGWASADTNAAIANEAWGGSGKEPVLRGPMDYNIAGRRVDPASFLTEPDRTVVVEVNNQLNASVEAFGRSFWNFIEGQSVALGGRVKKKTPLRAIKYSDRYLNSPLPVRLLREVLTNAPGVDGSTVVTLTTASQLSNAPSSSPIYLKHDWRLANHRDSVVQGLFAADFPQRFRLSIKDKRDVAHGRVLRLSYTDGDVVLHLDQGFGYWTTTAPVQFMFSAAIADQISELRRVLFQVRAVANYASWIALKEEK